MARTKTRKGPTTTPPASGVKVQDLLAKLSTTRVLPWTAPTRSERAGEVDPQVQPIWITILDRTEAIGYSKYVDFVRAVLCEGIPADSAASGCECSKVDGRGDLVYDAELLQTRVPRFRGVESYETLKTITEIFLLLECGFGLPYDEASGAGVEPKYNRLDADVARTWGAVAESLGKLLGDPAHSYLRNVLDKLYPTGWENLSTNRPWCNEVFLPTNEDIHPYCAICPIELIWSYWHEEAMLVQSMNAITRRFQNVRGPHSTDPLAELELAPLWPLNNLLWGYLQNERDLLSVARRNFEYDHHYGIKLLGSAVPGYPSADSRSKFLTAFHNLLNTCVAFYKQDANTQVIAEGFPVLNALRECHLVLAQGAHNQFRDLPWTSRVEMLIQQWLLARPEMQRFLPGRPMVPYREGWMGQVDAMKKLQNWTDVSAMHFNDLAVHGERLLLSIRYTNWTEQSYGEDIARAWARFWKPEVQGYIHAYRTATGVDLSDLINKPVNDTPPSRLLMAKLQQQRQYAKAG